MTDVHAAGAVALAAVDLAVLAAAVALRAGVAGARVWLDRAILAALAVAGVDAALGVGLIASGHAPSDLLHVVYGGVACIVLPLARWAGRSPDLRRRSLWVAAGSVVLVGVLLRLAQTG